MNEFAAAKSCTSSLELVVDASATFLSAAILFAWNCLTFSRWDWISSLARLISARALTSSASVRCSSCIRLFFSWVTFKARFFSSETDSCTLFDKTSVEY